MRIIAEDHRGFVYSISKAMLNDPVVAEDVVQSVFFTVWKNPEAFRDGSARAWLTTVTKNRVRDILRSRAVSREVAFPEGLVERTSFADDVHQRLEMNRVRIALASLPSVQRSLIEQGFLAGRSHGELAEMTGLPLGTVKTRIRAGLHSLRKTLVA